MRTKTINLFQYDELTPAAQEKARDWYRNASAGDDFWSESPLECIATAGELLGIDFDRQRGRAHAKAIWFSGFSSQGDGASFDGTWHARDVRADALAKEFPQSPGYKPNSELQRIAGELAEVAARYPEARAACSSSHRYHSLAVDSEPGDEMPNNGGHSFESDEYDAALEEWRDAFPADELADTLRDFTSWAYRLLESEYEHQNSDEQIAEAMRASEYEFTEEGELA